MQNFILRDGVSDYKVLVSDLREKVSSYSLKIMVITSIMLTKQEITETKKHDFSVLFLLNMNSNNFTACSIEYFQMHSCIMCRVCFS